jgi:DNA-binding NarL/FixJ family response regulator
MTKDTEELRILVADDHALMRRGIRALLDDQRGWTVVAEARNGREAVDQAKRLKPDIAILDVTMPELDGLEATRQLRETVRIPRSLSSPCMNRDRWCGGCWKPVRAATF